MIENGFVYLREKAGWLAEYLHELTVFPKGKHDDQSTRRRKCPPGSGKGARNRETAFGSIANNSPRNNAMRCGKACTVIDVAAHFPLVTTNPPEHCSRAGLIQQPLGPVSTDRDPRGA